MITLLYGANELAIRRRLQLLRDEADGGSGMIDSNINSIEGANARPQDILAAAMAAPFLSPKRLVVVEHFLERFEQRAEQRQPRALAPFDPLFTALEAGLPESTLLVFLGLPFLAAASRKMAVTPRNPMVARLAKVPGVSNEHMEELKKEELNRFIREEAAARGIRLKPGRFPERFLPGESVPQESDPAALLAALFQGDTLTLSNELEKLSLYAMGKDVTVAEVNRVCAGDRESNRFNFADSIMDGRLREAFDALALLRRDGESTQGLLSLLLDGYRRAATILDLLDTGASPEEIGRNIGPAGKWPNLRDQAIRRARGLGHWGLHAAYEALVEADRTSKLGDVDDEIAFEIVITKLSALSGSARTPLRR
ncbi:MAG: DNA polymerase III subunit delta [Tepidiformaceae bacterium]